MEVWQVIKKHPDYHASSYGRIASTKQGVKLLTPQRDDNGYESLVLDGKHKFVHQLVATTFIPNPFGLRVVNHKDWNPSNNRVDNLEWMSDSENSLYRNPNPEPRKKAIMPTHANEWRTIPDYPDYEVSDTGLVRRKDSLELMTVDLNKGYHTIKLREDGRTQCSVHILVASAFIGPIPKGMVVNHINGKKTDNAVSNLEIVTHKDNVAHALAVGLRKTKVVHQYSLKGEYIATYPSYKAAAESVGANPPSISDAVRGITKTAHGYVWKGDEPMPDKMEVDLSGIDVERPIVQLKDGCVIGRFVNATEAATKVPGTCRQNIEAVTCGRRKKCGGYQWVDERLVSKDSK
uniref:Intron-encoded homing endonuclease HNH n=1 Tax=Clandestinovirus TaxID=2831644 RepID=A0A8F8KTK4_9VIRU|nr:intron-encoded homing endonuclease HNH [Clandestinovirus]